MQKAKGAYLWDVDGNRYIDYRMAFGPIILGHSYDAVDARVIEEIQQVCWRHDYRTGSGGHGEDCGRCARRGNGRLACSGTEATCTPSVWACLHGREIVLKFEGNYHGFHDYTLWSTYAPSEAYGNARSPIPVPASSGIPKELGQKIITLPFNDFEGFERVMKSYGAQIAAVISEPCQGNCGAIEPQKGFLELIRKETEDYAVFHPGRGQDRLSDCQRRRTGVLQDQARPGDLCKALGNVTRWRLWRQEGIMSIIGHGVAQGGRIPITNRALRLLCHPDHPEGTADPENHREAASI